MSMCTDKNLKNLKKTYKSQRIFKKDLNDDNFLLICKILKNLGLKRLKKCISKSLLKKKKKHAKFIKKILDETNSVEKRKAVFIELSKKSFKKWIFDMIKAFYKRCLNVMIE